MSSRLLLLLASALAAVLTSCGSSAPPTDAHGGVDPVVGLTVFTTSQRQSLPSLSGSTLTGRSLSARSYASGSPLVINVWASWCSPCRNELPLLARASGRGTRVLGIVERDDASRARAFARRQGATYPSLVDPEGRLLATLRMLPQVGIPSTLVVAGDGHLAARIVGPLTSSSLRRALARARS